MNRGVVRRPLPVDQVVNDEVIRLERQYVPYHLDFEFQFLRQQRHLGDAAEVAE